MDRQPTLRKYSTFFLFAGGDFCFSCKSHALFSQPFFIVAIRPARFRLHPVHVILYNPSMKHLFYKVLTILLLASLLTGCSASPDAQPTDTADAYSDEVATVEGADSASEAQTNDAESATPDPGLAPAEQPIDALLPADHAFAILFVNVGKADAAILRFGEHTVLVDTGSEDSRAAAPCGAQRAGRQQDRRRIHHPQPRRTTSAVWTLSRQISISRWSIPPSTRRRIKTARVKSSSARRSWALRTKSFRRETRLPTRMALSLSGTWANRAQRRG